MNSDKIKITLTKEEKEMCDASPIEVFLYYLYYPKQLLKDATSMNLNPYDLFLSSWNTAIKYWNNKNVK